MEETRAIEVRSADDEEELRRLSRRVRSTWGETVARRGELLDPAEGELLGAYLDHEIRTRAAAAGCRRLWLVTTNDNVPAIGFYQRWGMDLVALRRDAVTEARARLKPEIPETGFEDIPIRHELEFEIQP